MQEKIMCIVLLAAICVTLTTASSFDAVTINNDEENIDNAVHSEFEAKLPNNGDDDNDVSEEQFQDPQKKKKTDKKIQPTMEDIAWEEHFKHVFPGRIPGPKSYKDKIAVVGAGPGGIHMAYLLKQKGFKNIDIYEQTDEIGGKSKSIDHRGAIHDMGTVYITADYQQVLKLIKKYTPSKLKAPEVASVWLNATSTSNGIQFSRYAFGVLQQKHPQMSAVDLQAYVVGLVSKYIIVHRSLFGMYIGDLMPEPKPSIMHAIRGSFMDFLVRNKLEDLQDLFIATFSLQGYGQLDEVPALYGLMWHSPTFMQELVLTIMGQPGAYSLLEGGFQQLWENIASQEKLKVKKGKKITWLYVRNLKHGGHYHPDEKKIVSLSYEHGNHVHTKHYDFVVWSGPIRDSLRYFHGPSFYDEKKLFWKMENSYYTTTLLDEEGATRSVSPVDWFYGNIYSKKDNLIWATRDTYSMLNDVYGDNYRKALTDTGPDKKKKLRTSVVYQFSHRKEKPTQKEVTAELTKQYNEMGAKKQTIVKQYIWQYFMRFTQQQIECGSHWRVLELQGKHNIWFVGGSLSFESVKSVVEYNQLLVNRMESVADDDDNDDDDDDDDNDIDDDDDDNDNDDDIIMKTTTDDGRQINNREQH